MKNSARWQPVIWFLILFCGAHARQLEIVAHRGANHLAPENTVAATEMCVDLNVDYVEVDVRTSKDGIMYILHDKTLDRTTNGSGAIRDRSSEYIDSLDAGSWFGANFSNEKVPRLRPFLEQFKGKIKIYFDVKDADLEELLSVIREYGIERDCFFWFSDDQRAAELRKLAPHIPLKMNAVDVDGLKRVLAYNPQIIEYRLQHLTPEFVAFCRENSLKLMAHALEEGAERNYQDIIDSPADMVNLDKADQMLELLVKRYPDNPIRQTLKLDGVEREYFVRLPIDFDPTKTYWPLISVHGGGGNGRSHFLAKAVREKADLLVLKAIVISPSFTNDDFQASRFPSLGEGEFLIHVLSALHRDYKLQSKILLTGYSRGGQFSHRFAFANPEIVEAVAPFAAGTWTTPDGGLLIESQPKIGNPNIHLANSKNASSAPERLRSIFTPRVAKVAGLKPVSGAEQVPFLVMCGTLDPRIETTREFALTLIEAGFDVEAGWPKTPHGGRNDLEFRDEFEKYSSRAVEFFLRVVEE